MQPDNGSVSACRQPYCFPVSPTLVPRSAQCSPPRLPSMRRCFFPRAPLQAMREPPHCGRQSTMPEDPLCCPTPCLAVNGRESTHGKQRSTRQHAHLPPRSGALRSPPAPPGMPSFHSVAIAEPIRPPTLLESESESVHCASARRLASKRTTFGCFHRSHDVAARTESPAVTARAVVV